MPLSKYHGGYARDPYPEIREALDREYLNLPAQDIEALLESANIDPEYMENFLSTLGSVGTSVVRALPTVAGPVGTVLGTAVGGPVGGLVGGALGSAAGGALGGRQRPGQPPPAPQAPPTGSQPAPQIPAISAVAQLLQIIFNPLALQALVAMLMGGAGRPNLMVGNTLVPPGAVATTIAELANQAAAEYNAVAPGGSEVPRYLLDERGEFLCDPAVPGQRAAVLVERFNEAARQEYWARDEDYNEYDLEEDREDNMYDEMDLIGLYSEDWED